MYIHHLGLDQNYIYNFPKQISKISHQELMASGSFAFDWDRVTVLVAGDKKLLKELKRIRKNVKVVNWKDYL